MRNLKMDLDDEYGETLSKLELHKNDSEMNRLKKEIAIASTRLQEKQSHLRADQRKLLGLDKTLESLTKRKEIEHQSAKSRKQNAKEIMKERVLLSSLKKDQAKLQREYEMLKKKIRLCQGKQPSIPMNRTDVKCPVTHGMNTILSPTTVLEKNVNTSILVNSSTNDPNDDDEGSSIVDLDEDAMVW
mmetsp:Transcript_29778/g.41409  ORF Transcript_29778/g.41409 Transcript_29778/m.41409 type:complete len:187 (+) Transcript_29778:813-1373(+)